MNSDPTPTPPSAPPSRLASLLLPLGPLTVLLVVGIINSLGGWPAFRQQDTSVLHWLLANHPDALKGLNQDQEPRGTDPRNPLRNYLTLENMDLSGLDLDSSDLGDVSIENVSLAGARLVNANLSCADVINVNFSGAKLMHSRLDYSDCGQAISTGRLHCGQEARREVTGTILPFRKPQKMEIMCLVGSFVGTDFSAAQIRGDQGRRGLSGKDKDKRCGKLLVLVGDMSGARFNKAKLTCVALINRPAPPLKENGQQLIFNGLSFAEARLDRVALLKGPFRFTNFERATLLGLFLNLDADKVDLDYSRLNEIQCRAPSENSSSTSRAEPTDGPCLLVPQNRVEDVNNPLHLNLLWSTLVTNLKPSANDAFLCTPPGDLPAWVEDRPIESAGYWLVPTSMEPSPRAERLPCPESHLLSPPKAAT